jgi:hypothetical protein
MGSVPDPGRPPPEATDGQCGRLLGLGVRRPPRAMTLVYGGRPRWPFALAVHGGLPPVAVHDLALYNFFNFF